MTTPAFQLGKDRLDTATLVRLAEQPAPPLAVGDDVEQRARAYRARIDEVLRSSSRVYGINTGFGFLADVAIAKDKLQELQINLVRSHACGVGEPLGDEQVRGLLILRAHTFLLGHSAVRWETVQAVLRFIEHDILPVIPCQGSVGASGDLAPLAHLALGLMGEGEVRYRGERQPAGEVLRRLGLKPLIPEAKEGLSLINGTHFMTTIAAFAVEEAKTLVVAADASASLSLDAVRGTLRAFDPRIQDVRGQSGQKLVAANIRALFAGRDGIVESHKDCSKVQDPYSFRCVPQVHGATRDALAYVQRVVDQELNAVTDNPLVFEDGDVISGGNFHGQPIAIVMDFLAIAVAELGSIAERRIEKITNPHLSGLPAFATRDSGLNSGFMIPHVVAAALVSENKILCHPASVDSIPTSADKEDHVSMGPIAARKAREIIRNVRRILAIELLAACQGVDLLAPLRPAPALERLYGAVREQAPLMEKDRSLAGEIESVARWLEGGGVAATVAAAGVPLQS